MVANTGLSAAGFFDKSYWYVTLTRKGKKTAKTAGYDRNCQSGV